VPFGVFGSRWEILCSTCFATTFLHIRSRLARSRPSVDEGGGRYCVGFSRGYGTPRWDCDRSRCTSRDCGRCGNTVDCRFMDTHRRDTGGLPPAVEHLLGSWRSVDPYPVGNARCRLGIARTWRLVGGCSPVWMEAHRASRTKQLGLLLLLS